MDHDGLQQRGRALENLFFENLDQQLVAKLRESSAKEQAQDNLVAATGISDPELASDLVGLGIETSTMSAFSLFPLVWVAWCDKTMTDSEKAAIIKAAKENNIADGSEAMQLLQSWLKNNPCDEIKDAWIDYAGELKNIAAPETVDRVKRTVIARAKQVSTAAGGFLGLTSSCSEIEKQTLDRIEKAFG